MCLFKRKKKKSLDDNADNLMYAERIGKLVLSKDLDSINELIRFLNSEIDDGVCNEKIRLTQGEIRGYDSDSFPTISRNISTANLLMALNYLKTFIENI